VSQYDRDLAYAEFLKPNSKIRLMFATTCLGMGVNFKDVARVVAWKIPITKSLGDVWQRLGRGGRGEGVRSQAYIMLPYWLFDMEGMCRPSTQPLSTQPPATKRVQAPVRTKGMQNQLPVDRARLRSYLSQCTTPSDISDAEDNSQELLATQSDTEPHNSQGSGPRLRPRYWTKAEVEQRSNIPASWLLMVNGTCHRQGFLKDLGEDKLMPCERPSVAKDSCCSACNPMLLPLLTFPPPQAAVVGVLRSGTHAYSIFLLVEAYAVQRAVTLFGREHARCPIPAGAYMARDCRLALIYALVAAIPEGTSTTPMVTGDIAFNAMCEKVPLLASWDPRDTECSILMLALVEIKRMALINFVEYSDSVRQRRDSRRAVLQQAGDVASSNPVPTGIPLDVLCRQRDNEVALEVAERVADYTQVPCSSTTGSSIRTPKRRPLQERDVNEANKKQRTPRLETSTLTFTPTSSRGRKRTLTSKGQENYQV
jgi:hypothetical protein